jgi:hypothetical protein
MIGKCPIWLHVQRRLPDANGTANVQCSPVALLVNRRQILQAVIKKNSQHAMANVKLIVLLVIGLGPLKVMLKGVSKCLRRERVWATRSARSM